MNPLLILGIYVLGSLEIALLIGRWLKALREQDENPTNRVG